MNRGELLKGFGAAALAFPYVAARSALAQTTRGNMPDTSSVKALHQWNKVSRRLKP